MPARESIVFMQPNAFHEMQWGIEILEKLKRPHVVNQEGFDEPDQPAANTGEKD